ncbi:MAG: 4-hydroxy-tetrahydrodipicolinate reductase [Clostridiales bacterium]|nr:4-hydroxy-tetrahydrodipicolinate reductase [Clostridiales bacterium]MDD7309675.1 4-hydroxy-tetrahydrodipicolinate reductase [Eubacteriales bacterium]MDY5346788.1 4-hydroxy-tetrahydrodipicolinate reductase [Eubacteriales bacterium]
MIRIILSGCNGRMGHAVAAIAEQYDAVIAAGVDRVIQPSASFPIYQNIAEYTGDADVIIDFSHVSALPSILNYAVEKQIPAILATTGYQPSDLAAVDEAAHHVPLFRSANMSVGINLLAMLTKKAASILGENYDIEIVEKHHNQKLDAPSGTALILADAASSAFSEGRQYVYDRHAVRKPRSKDEIGIHSIRGGTICGDHDVIFAGYNEVITLSHSVSSREVFASGALRAAQYMASVHENRLYTMADVLGTL